jgi:hypothetical protein
MFKYSQKTQKIQPKGDNMLKLQNETKIIKYIKYTWATLDYPAAHIQAGDTINILTETSAVVFDYLSGGDK